MQTVEETSRAGLTALVAGIVASLPSKRVTAPSGAWHWAFLQLRDRHGDELPELRELEFLRSSGSPPVSEGLESIFQIIDLAGTGSTLNPNLVVRQFDADQKKRLQSQVVPLLGPRRHLVRSLGKELQELLSHAPGAS